jgi:hypothetical protein
MHGPINVKSPNNTSKWQMGFNSAFKGLRGKMNILGGDSIGHCEEKVHMNVCTSELLPK